MRSDEGHADFTDFHSFFDLCGWGNFDYTDEMTTHPIPKGQGGQTGHCLAKGSHWSFKPSNYVRDTSKAKE